MDDDPPAALNPDALADRAWDEALAAAVAAGGDYHDYWTAIGSAAKAARESAPELERTFALFASIASLMLQPDKPAEPYTPAIVMSTGRTMAEEDLGQEELVFLGSVVSTLEPPKLRARVGDILWRRSERESRYRFGVIALDAFLLVDLTPDSWAGDGEDCWARAIEIAYRSNAKEKLSQICQHLLTLFDEATVNDGYYFMALATLLFRSRVPEADTHKVADRLHALSSELEESGDLWRARDFLLEAERWYRKLGARDTILDIHVREADLWQREAAMASSGEAARPAFVVATYLESALKALLKVPRAQRGPRGLDPRIEVIRWEIRDAHAAAVQQMVAFDSPVIDLTKAAQQARARVKELDVITALKNFVTLAPYASDAESRQQATAAVNEPRILNLVSRVVYTPDARVAARSTPTLGEENQNERIWHVMVSEFSERATRIAHGVILPALSQLHVDHGLSLRDFKNIAQSSAVVPADREGLFALALFHGFNRDFTSALYILAPQMENLVRQVLKSARVSTSTFDADNLETENSLNALLERPEAAEIFGPDLVFELRALYCEQVGPNLRNQVAHGLLDDDESASSHAVYAWWQALRLVYMPYWNQYRAEAVPTDEDRDDPDQ
ncbi:DUF4209 domain-containing protein [Rathayibacter sp. VKM Ac-2759]|uniref:DUF4209 domain-containing protein n=1 Tax=Microbacteriaceae TaxID=85023 RepID=UPI001315CB7D|nr:MULTISPECIES: DUF4209 domain-containing protein [Microbacteriaceae]QHC66375.1 DUF4209 domain-containing protein [Rathayibacter sp. VKM Ac-2759]